MRVVRVITVAAFLLSVLIWGAGKIHVMRLDKTPPVIESDSDVIHVNTTADEVELKQGLRAIDNVDGDITDDIIVANISAFSEKGVSKIEYLVFDERNNVGRYERTVYYDDYRSPRISLSAPLMYRQNSEIVLTDRLFAEDQLEGDISDKLRYSSANASPYETGVYELYVEARNSYGDVVKETLLLNIIPYENDRGRIQLREYLIYVTAGQYVSPEQYLEKVVDSEGNMIPYDSVVITKEVDTDRPGVGQYRYVLNDKNGNVAAITFLAVIVTE